MCALVTGVQTCALPIFAIPRLIPLVPPATKAVLPASRLSRNVVMRRLSHGSDPGLTDRIRSPFETQTDTRNTKIGSTSCRERVCQSVSISVVAVPYKTKKYNRTTLQDNHSNKTT